MKLNRILKRPRYEGSETLVWRPSVAWLGCLVAACAIAFTGIAGIRAADVQAVKGRCANYAEQTGAEAEFKQFGFFDYGCYVKTDDGWVKREDVVKVEK